MYHLPLTLQPSMPFSATTPAFAFGDPLAAELDDLFCLSTPSGAAVRPILICGSRATTSTSVIDATAAADGPLALFVPGALLDSSIPSSDMNPFALSRTPSKPRQRGKRKASELLTPCSHGDPLAYDVHSRPLLQRPLVSCLHGVAAPLLLPRLAAELEALVGISL